MPGCNIGLAFDSGAIMRQRGSSRRAMMIGAAAATGLWHVAGARAGTPFSRDLVVDQARALAASPFADALPPLPDAFRKLDYDGYRGIRFRREQALLDARGAFRLHLLHPGFLFTRPVAIHLVENGAAHRVAYDGRLFDYGRGGLDAEAPSDVGFAGFRLLYPLNEPGVLDEVVSFLGASYFRFLAKGDRYGLSARALAIGVGGSVPEEFPFFREFWVEQPAVGRDDIVVHALLDSPSLSGAYSFNLRPRPRGGVAGTAIDVSASLFLRKDVHRIGIAPMTSMFLRGESDPHPRDDFRPEVHDSDGLLIHNGGGEWLWRPLRNTSSVSFSGFADDNPRGFGLLQRNRDFGRYQDLEARYDLRPSYWIEPRGPWGAGRIELVESPDDDETGDNINAFWTPAAAMPAGGRVDIADAITAAADPNAIAPGGIAVATHQTSTRVAGSKEPVHPNERRFLIDFAGGRLSGLAEMAEKIEVVATASAGAILRTFAAPNPRIGGIRGGFDLRMAAGESADLRLFLRLGEETLTETWTYPWTHESPRPAAVDTPMSCP